MRVLVTGANGFVGSVLLHCLATAGHTPVAAVRAGTVPGFETRATGDIGAATDWAATLRDIDGVVHLAARVHQLKDHHPNPLAMYRAVNTEATRALAEAAANAGVKKLVFLSSVKVNGERTEPGKPFREADEPAPADAYALSKWEAEQALASYRDRMDIGVLRPPLVYGPGVGANFGRLLRLCDSALPLPFGAVENRRSMIYVDNLCDVICRSLTGPGGTFLVCDDAALSIADLVRCLRRGLGRPARLLPVPERWLRAVGGLAGRRAEVGRLLDSLEIDASAVRAALGWRPPVPARDALAATARAWRDR